MRTKRHQNRAGRFVLCGLAVRNYCMSCWARLEGKTTSQYTPGRAFAFVSFSHTKKKKESESDESEKAPKTENRKPHMIQLPQQIVIMAHG